MKDNDFKEYLESLSDSELDEWIQTYESSLKLAKEVKEARK
jgi:hypothetical protein